jgi:hypothetical protein
MREASPPKGEAAAAASVSPEGSRKVATGGMRRILKSRMKSALSMSTLPEARGDEKDPYSDSEEEEGESAGRLTRTTSTSNHYTLNIPSPAAPQSDLPYILLGCVPGISRCYRADDAFTLATCNSSSICR